jgi:hypothetical protein
MKTCCEETQWLSQALKDKSSHSLSHGLWPGAGAVRWRAGPTGSEAIAELLVDTGFSM